MSVTVAEMARAIEHTLLRPEATPQQIDVLCDEALRYGFAGVCVNPIYVRRAAERLTITPTLSLEGRGRLESTPLVVAAVGFPLGANTTATKADEARRAIDDGATEIDMVVALGALTAGDRRYVCSDIEAVARVVHQATGNRLLKVILETAALTTDQLILGCRCCAEAEADFVKTSTGFHPRGGATVEHVRQLHRHASPLRVKAAGGIRTAEAAKAMLEAGAVRIGTSAGVAILEQLRAFRLRRT
ncbi:MAG: deoxyribose-phosphate aldolase [Planctomycetota bacterium]